MISISVPDRKRGITLKDQEFVDLYVGGPDELRGNATACYRCLHPRCAASTAETEGPATLRKPQVQAYLEEKAKRVQELTDINAAYVLNQSVRFLEISFGDKPTPDKFNAAGIGKALELIGKNVTVQAFKSNLEISENPDLVAILRRQQRIVEERAANLKGVRR